MTKEQVLAVMKALVTGFTAPDGPVARFDEDGFAVVIFDIPGNDGGFRIRLAEDAEESDRHFSFEAWCVDADGKRTSDVVRGNGGDTPEDAMEVSQWHRLREPPGPPDPVDTIVL